VLSSGGCCEFRKEMWASCAPRYNIAPTQSVIVVGDDGKRYMKQMRWGLIPSWAKDPSIGNRMINVRVMTGRRYRGCSEVLPAHPAER